MTVADEIKMCLSALSPTRLELLDESAKHAGHTGAAPGGNTHWKLTIVSAAFAGKTTVARHRMIYEALGELMQNPIHALSISAKAVEEIDA